MKIEDRTVTNVMDYLKANPKEPVVSVYEKLKPGVICSFPVDDALLYAEKVTCEEIEPYMSKEYNGFNWSLIWAKIRHDRSIKNTNSM